MRSIKLFIASTVLSLSCLPFAEALLVVGDSGPGSIYTSGVGADAGWDYVGHLNESTTKNGVAASSVSYVSNGWFVTANHVWTGDVIDGTTLNLGGTDYAINRGTYTSVTNANGSAADLCMFQVNGSIGLPAGTQVLETTPLWSDSLRLIGNGYDNGGAAGMTWGDGDIYSTGNGPSRSTYTDTQALNGRDTTYYLSVYDSGTTGSAHGQIYDSGGGAFVNGQLAGVMVAVGTGLGDGQTYIADFSVYGSQINATAAIPEPSVLVLALVAPLAAFFIRRTFMM